MHIRSTALTLIAAAGLGGCGGSHSSTTSGAAQSSAAASQPATTTAASSSAPATSSTTATTSAAASAPTVSTTSGAGSGGAGGAAVGGPAECRASGLSLSYLGGQGATGHGELGFALRNTTPSRCRTIGYPGIQFLNRSGGALPTSPTHTTSDFFGTLPRAPVTVTPGSSFSFRLGVSHGGGADTGCQTAYGLQVIPPDDTATLRVDIPGGASECGSATVSPVQPGTSAFR